MRSKKNIMVFVAAFLFVVFMIICHLLSSNPFFLYFTVMFAAGGIGFMLMWFIIFNMSGIDEGDWLNKKLSIKTSFIERAARRIRRNPNDIDAMCDRAEGLTRFSKSAEGEQLYRRAIELCMSRGEVRRAASIYSEFLNRFDAVLDSVNQQREIALEFISMQRVNDAARSLELWLKKNPSAPERSVISLDLAMIYARHFLNDVNAFSGSGDLARNLLNEVIENNRGSKIEVRARALLATIPVYQSPKFTLDTEEESS